MAQTCRVCAHPETKEIEQAIVHDKAHTQIAEKYGIHFQSVRYHAQNHLPQKLTQAVQRKEEKHAENMLDGINDLLDRTRRILDEAEEKDQKSLALKAIKEARSTYELLSKIAVKLEEYRREDEKKEDKALERQASKGLQALSDDELKCWVQLSAKITDGDPSYELDPETRMFVDGVRRIWPEPKSGDGNSFGTSYQRDSDQSKSGQTRARKDKSSQNTRSDEGDDLNLELDDLDGLDLNTSSNDQIPSEETDPRWLRKLRKR